MEENSGKANVLKKTEKLLKKKKKLGPCAGHTQACVKDMHLGNQKCLITKDRKQAHLKI